ncbi:pectin lyase-like protein [Thozetella sp. PMI_491]|nr:pectin lyase-like protein [Thozetella sp. PMI_491]
MMRGISWIAALLGATAAAQSIRENGPAGIETVEKQFVRRQEQNCTGLTEGTPSTWWRASIGHNGTTPYASDSSYQYYRTAVQYGADPTGKNDSSDAINWAISAWERINNTVTTHPAYVYVPPGTYLIKKPIQMVVSTFLVGDPLDPPTFVAHEDLNTTIINGYDMWQGELSSTKNFYMSVRNLKLDTTNVSRGTKVRAMDWSVSQGSSLTNVEINMPSMSEHVGITMSQGGSGTIIADCTFTGGKIGLELSNQQYMLKGLSFDGSNTAIFFNNAFIATVQGASFKNCNIGIDIARSGSAGSVSVVDTTSACHIGVSANVTGSGQGSLVLDNFAVTSGTAVKSSTGSVVLEGSVPAGQTWMMGNEYPQDYQMNKTYSITRPSALLSNGKYFTMPLPQYEKYNVSQIVSVKLDPDYKVYGDNVHDDGPAINSILKKYAGCKIVFFPQGYYRTNETIYIPPGSRIVGEVLSVISGVGNRFANADSPVPIVQVGKPGEKGVAQISDMLFSTAEILPGAVIVQVNMAGDKPGDVGFWNCVIRVGGSVDSLVTNHCDAEDPSSCKAAFALLHVTKTGSAYIEDMWGWVADHALDPHLPQQNIAVGRGALIESTGPTWLVGTAFEHCVLYQYSLNLAQNVYIGMQQTEGPYWQGTGTPLRAPAPWNVNTAYGDPTFSNCDAQGQSGNDQCYRAWAHYMVNSTDVVIHGSGMWVFYNKMNDNKLRDPMCEETNGICQLNMAYVSGGNTSFWYSLSSKSTTNIVYDGTSGAVAAQESNQGSWGGVIAAYLRHSGDPSSENGAGGALDAGSVLGLGLGLPLAASLACLLW